MTLAATACGDAGGDTTTTATIAPGTPSPEEAVRTWVAAVNDGDMASLAAVVPDPQLALLVAIDNSLALEDTAALARDGVPADLAAAYWASFEQNFGEFAGLPLADLEVETAEEFSVDEHRFASVTVAFPTRIGSSQLIASEATPDRWRIDPLASLAPALLTPLRSLATTLPAGPDGDTVRALLVEVLPSLRAAADQPSDDAIGADQRLELEALVRFLAPQLDG